MKKTLLPFALAAVLVLSSCGTVPRGTPSGGGAGDGPVSGAPATKSAGQSANVESFLSRADDAIALNHLAEAIRYYVSALGELSKTPDAASREKSEKITKTLNTIGSRLSIEPQEAWIQDDGSQKSLETRPLAKGSAVQPAVYLYENYGTAKTPVPDAYIRFEFVKNDGELTGFVGTDSLGRANTAVTRVAQSGIETVIRAYPVFSVSGFSFAYKTVYRDFTYLAPSATTFLSVFERGPDGVSDNPRTIDAVATALRGFGLDPVPYNGALSPGKFQAAFAGDAKALAALSAGTKASLFAYVFVDMGTPTQVEQGGKKYNIFIAYGKATLRLARSDGSIAYSIVRDGIKSQGSSPKASIDDCVTRSRDALLKALEEEGDKFKAAIAD